MGEKTFVAITMTQHPLTGEALPRTKNVSPETTLAEIFEWVKQEGTKDYPIDDLRIVENT